MLTAEELLRQTAHDGSIDMCVALERTSELNVLTKNSEEWPYMLHSILQYLDDVDAFHEHLLDILI